MFIKFSVSIQSSEDSNKKPNINNNLGKLSKGIYY